MQTCVPHLLSLINVTIAFLFDVLYSRYGSKNVPQGMRNGPGISTHTTHFKSAYLWIKVTISVIQNTLHFLFFRVLVGLMECPS